MVALRVTKYNPIFRTSEGTFTRDEWTSISDVGKPFADGILTLEKYLEVENAYVEAVQFFMFAKQIQSMKITYIENHPIQPKIIGEHERLAEESRVWLKGLQIGLELTDSQLEGVIRLNLREACWTRISGDNNSYIHFGHDYYMYLGCDGKFPSKNLRGFPNLMFAEEMESPYHEDGIDE